MITALILKRGQVMMTLLLIFSGTTSFTQITYFDINPDTTINTDGGLYDFDFIPGGSTQCQIKLYKKEDNTVYIKFSDSTCFVSGFIDECYEAYPLSLDDTISDLNTRWIWLRPYYDYDVVYLAMTGLTWCTSPFHGKRDAFIGLKWFNNDIPYYCWVRVDVAEDASWFLIKDYAYGPYLIIAGRTTSTGMIEKINNNNYCISYSNEMIRVYTYDGSIIDYCSMMNLFGQEFNITKNMKEVIIHNRQFKPGIYLLRLEKNKESSVIKLCIN
jgi:hypothetical protein